MHTYQNPEGCSLGGISQQHAPSNRTQLTHLSSTTSTCSLSDHAVKGKQSSPTYPSGPLQHILCSPSSAKEPLDLPGVTKCPAAKQGTMKPNLSSLVVQHMHRERGSQQPSLSSLSAQFSFKEGNESQQPSLSGLATQHLSEEKGSHQRSLSGLAIQHLCKEKESQQSSLSGLAVQYLSKEKESQQSSLSGLAAQHLSKEKQSQQPGLSGLAVQHLSKEKESQQSSLSGLAVQHMSKEKESQQYSLSGLAAQHLSKEKESQQSSLSGLAAQHLSKEKESQQPSLAGLAAEHLSKEQRSKQPNLFSLASQHLPGSAQYTPNERCKPLLSGVSRPVYVSSQPSLNSDLMKKQGVFVAGVDTDCSDINRSSPLSQFVHLHQNTSCPPLPGRKLSQHQLEHSVTNNTVVTNTQHKPLLAPPGFKDIHTSKPTFKFHSDCSVAPDLKPPTLLGSSTVSGDMYSHIHLSRYTSSIPAQPLELSMFSVTLCREYCVDHSCLQYKHMELAHSLVLDKLAHAFESLTLFNFSESSPDDVVKDKQTDGFNC